MKVGLGLRLAFLALGFGGGSAVMLLVVNHHQINQFEGIFQQQEREEAARLQAQIELAGRAFRNFTNDYSYWDDMVKFLHKPDRKWAVENIDVTLDSFQIDGVWILNPQAEPVYAAVKDRTLAIPLARDELQAHFARGYFSHFFIWVPAGLLEVRIAPIQPSADARRLTQPRGWLMAGRLWDSALLNELQETSGLKIEIARPQDTLAPGDFRASRLAFSEDLPGSDTTPVASLHATRFIPLVSGFARLTSRSIWLVGGICFTLFILLVLVIHFSYNVPLHVLTRATTSGEDEVDPGLAELLSRKDEIGHLAGLVRAMRSHQKQMAREIQRRNEAERQLQESAAEQEVFARELHDDTLQSLYAIGMAIDAAGRKTDPNPAEISHLLARTVPEINRTIASLRVAIAGLENHRTDPARLRQVLLRLLDSLAKPAGLEVHANLEAEAIALLNRGQTFHLVRLVREILTNTLKHARAKSFRLDLHRVAAGVELVASDDGVGLPVDASERGGNGLQNLARRAENMNATLKWEQPPGGGLKITLEIPHHEDDEDE